MQGVVPNPPPGFETLSIEDQIAYIQSLWDLIAAGPKHVPVPDWHSDVLRERAKQRDSHPDAGRTWDDVRRDIERRLGDPSGE